LLLFLAGGAWMVSDGQPFGWSAVLFAAAGLVIFPAQLVSGRRPSRYTGGPLAAKRDRRVTAAALLGALLMGAAAVAGAASLALAYRTLVLGACGLFFLLVAVLKAGELFEDGPILHIGPDGYFDRRLMRRPIAWAEVVRIEAAPVGRQTFLRLLAKDGEANHRLMQTIADRMDVPGYSLNAFGLDCTLADMLKAIAEHRPDLFRSGV
jgi:hypothetical protein